MGQARLAVQQVNLLLKPALPEESQLLKRLLLTGKAPVAELEVEEGIAEGGIVDPTVVVVEAAVKELALLHRLLLEDHTEIHIQVEAV